MAGLVLSDPSQDRPNLRVRGQGTCLEGLERRHGLADAALEKRRQGDTIERDALQRILDGESVGAGRHASKASRQSEALSGVSRLVTERLAGEFHQFGRGAHRQQLERKSGKRCNRRVLQQTRCLPSVSQTSTDLRGKFVVERVAVVARPSIVTGDDPSQAGSAVDQERTTSYAIADLTFTNAAALEDGTPLLAGTIGSGDALVIPRLARERGEITPRISEVGCAEQPRFAIRIGSAGGRDARPHERSTNANCLWPAMDVGLASVVTGVPMPIGDACVSSGTEACSVGSCGALGVSGTFVEVGERRGREHEVAPLLLPRACLCSRAVTPTTAALLDRTARIRGQWFGVQAGKRPRFRCRSFVGAGGHRWTSGRPCRRAPLGFDVLERYDCAPRASPQLQSGQQSSAKPSQRGRDRRRNPWRRKDFGVHRKFPPHRRKISPETTIARGEGSLQGAAPRRSRM